MSIGLVTVAYGPTYQQFLPEWAAAVAALNTQPDEITIIGDDIQIELLEHISSILGDFQYITSQTVPTHHPQILVNEAINATETEWICKMDVDDLLHPHAFDGLNPAFGDVFMFGIQIGPVQMLPNHVSGPEIPDLPHNPVFSGSPFRRWVWEAAPFRDMIYEDWMFWIEAAKNGAKFTRSGRIDYTYRIHEHNITHTADSQYWEQVVKDMR